MKYTISINGKEKSWEIQTCGEGIVWWCPEFNLKMKTKGSKHSTSKVKTLKEIAAVDIEKLNSIKELVASAVSENRLKQGLDKLGMITLRLWRRSQLNSSMKVCCMEIGMLQWNSMIPI